MFKFKRSLTSALCLTFVMSCTVIHAGCDRVVKEDTHITTNPDGSQTKDTTKTVKDFRGGVKTVVMHEAVPSK